MQKGLDSETLIRVGCHDRDPIALDPSPEKMIQATSPGIVESKVFLIENPCFC
jgi:hypothetical protein